MQPIYKYDPSTHMLKEQPSMEMPVKPGEKEFDQGTYNIAHAVYSGKMFHYNQHIWSLKTIPCAPGTVWPDVDLIEDKDFQIGKRVIESQSVYEKDVIIDEASPIKMLTASDILVGHLVGLQEKIFEKSNIIGISETAYQQLADFSSSIDAVIKHIRKDTNILND